MGDLTNEKHFNQSGAEASFGAAYNNKRGLTMKRMLHTAAEIAAAAVLAVTVVFTGAALKAQAATPLTILINGKVFTPPDDPAQIINDRVMVPFRPIAESLGANANWNQEQQQVSVSLGNRSLSFVIGSSTMNLVLTDVTGSVVRQSVTLDSPAKLVNDRRAFVPIRALSEGLGATVAWDDATRTVRIITNTVLTPSPTPTPVISSAFQTTAQFEIISFVRAQTIFDNNTERSIFYYFDSQDPTASARMNMVNTAAKSVGAKVYGLDIRTSSNVDRNTWLWSYVSKTNVTPTLLFFYSDNQIIKYTAFTNQNDINTLFTNWHNNRFADLTPTPTVTPKVSATPTPTPSYDEDLVDDYFVELPKAKAQGDFQDGDRFVLVFYDSSRSGYQNNLNKIKDAVGRFAEYCQDQGNMYDIYYFDAKDEKPTRWWFGQDYYEVTDDGDSDMPNPVIFYASDGQVQDVEDSSFNINTIRNQFIRFLIENTNYVS
jgi:hypothetical protein